LPKLSGTEIIKILVRDFGFEVARQKGSHVILRKFSSLQKIVTVVPLHKEVKPSLKKQLIIFFKSQFFCNFSHAFSAVVIRKCKYLYSSVMMLFVLEYLALLLEAKLGEKVY
jgi:predicted RNA binding protein YcfA (HicA-like mRNA interferase family)